MHLAHWGLKRPPFPNGGNPPSFFLSRTHEEALARLHFLVDQRWRVGLVEGPSGAGKSILLDVLGRELVREGKAVAAIQLAGADRHELLWQAAVGLSLNPSSDDSPYRLWRAIADRLAEFRHQGLHAVFLIDDLDAATPDAIEQIVQLSRLGQFATPGWTLIGTLSRVDHAVIPGNLVELVELKVELAAWDLDETARYIEASLSHAGCRHSPFDDDALAGMHARGDGLPGRIRQLADLALIAGAVRGASRIDAATIDDVYWALVACRSPRVVAAIGA